MVVQAVRSAIFYALFLGQTVLLALLLGLIAIILRRPTEFGLAVGRYWGSSSLFLLRWIVGIRTRVEGAENVPEGPCIIAAKHQSDWDIFAILPYATRPAFIAKKQLMDIPFFGWAAKSLYTIPIDRSLGVEAIPKMLADAAHVLDLGCQIIIFPEGTRRAPLAPPDHRQGIARLYKGLDVPIVPVALNSGLYWGRESLVLWPGTARAKFLPAIPPGLETEEFRARLTGAIESETNRMILEAVEAGLTRPIPAHWREKLAVIAGAEPADGKPPSPPRGTTY